jgi:hypothetical protein
LGALLHTSSNCHFAVAELAEDGKFSLMAGITWKYPISTTQYSLFLQIAASCLLNARPV